MKTILFSGRLSEQKGGRVAIEALAIVARKVPDVFLVVAGKEDGYPSHMRELAESLGVGDKVKFTGWVDRDAMKTLNKEADVVLVPSICFDAFPRTVLEAMAVGTPVVGTCYGGAPEAIVDGVTGYVVNPFNIEEMAERLIDLLNDPEKRNKFGEASRQRIEKHFNLQDVVNKYLSAYEDLISKSENRTTLDKIKDWVKFRWIDITVLPSTVLLGLALSVATICLRIKKRRKQFVAIASMKNLPPLH